MNRRDLLRSIGAAGAAIPVVAAREFPANYDASKELARAEWKPSFLDDHQSETLATIGDLIVPGARQALANRFIDEILAVEKPETQRDFLNALAYVDGESSARYHTAFRHATAAQQMELLSYMAWPQSLEMWQGSVRGDPSAHVHFRMIKDWVSRAYYSSEAGRRELGDDGEIPHGELKGCQK